MKKRPSSDKTGSKAQLKALTLISDMITSSLGLEEILKSIVDITAQMMKSNICSIQLIDEKKKELIIKATQSISEDYIKKPPLKIGEGIAGKVALENRPAAVADISKEPEYRFKDVARKEGLCSLLSVPMSFRGKVIGVLNLYTSKPHAFSDNETEMLSCIAKLAAVAIENSRLVIKSNSMQEELHARKLLERAKGILMAEEKLTEEQAYLKIQRYAMDNRKSMKEVSEAIILSSSIKKNTAPGCAA